MADFVSLDAASVDISLLSLWEAEAEFVCPCGRSVALGNGWVYGCEDAVPCPCGRLYRLRLTIEVAEPAPAV